MKKINTRIPLIGLFLLLTIMALLLTMYSAKIYDSVAGNGYKNNTAYVASMYITEKIKQADHVTEISDRQITLRSDTDIDTIVYLYDGKLYEIAIYADKQLTPGSGEILFELKDMELSMTDHLLKISITDNNDNTITKRMAVYEK